METKIRCKHCGKSNYIKKGLRKTQNRGRIQKYKCLECNRFFTNDEGFYRMRNSEAKITQAIDLYFSSLSSRKVRNHFRRHLEHNASHITILDWARRYALKIQEYTNKLNPSLSGKYYMDETEIDCEGRNDFLWVCLDWETRFIPNIYYSIFSDIRHCTKFLQLIKKKHLPKYIQTDSAKYYPRAFENVFNKNEIEHRTNNVHETGKHNVRIETVFSKVKDRVNNFRGLKAKWSAPILLTGIILQHNFIEAHTTTGKIPCELAGLKLEAGTNRWLGLIKIASV